MNDIEKSKIKLNPHKNELFDEFLSRIEGYSLMMIHEKNT